MSQAETLFAIVDAAIIDGNGGPPIEHGTVLIGGKRILAVGGPDVVIPEQALRLSAQGKYIIPGLMDANVHLVLDFWPLTMVRYEGRYDELAIEAAQVALKAGVTTVFDTWGPRDFLCRARDRINAGEEIGARVFLAGNIVGLAGPYSNDFLTDSGLPEDFTSGINELWCDGVGDELVWQSPSQVRQAIRSYISRGINFLKFAVTTHCGDQRHILLSPRVQRVIVEECREAGLSVQTHSTTNEGLHLALDAEVDLMQHLDLTFGPEPLTGDLIDRIVASAIPGGLLPQTDYALAWYREKAEHTSWLRRYEVMDQNARALIAARAPLLLTTDAGLFSSSILNGSSWKSWQPERDSLLLLGEGHFTWLAAVEQKGMRAMDALLAATRDIARAYKVDRELGTIEPGKLADLVILDANPLANAQNYRAIHLVIKDGAIVDRDALPLRPHLTKICDSNSETAALSHGRLPCSLAHG